MSELSQTHLLLGKVKRSESAAWYPLVELLKHALILGRTGSGKTTLFYWLISQLVGKCGVWIIDRKRDFRHLVRVFPGKIIVFDMMRDFFCNPTQPVPYYHPKKWAGTFTQFYCKVFNFLNVGLGNMFQALHGLNENRRIYTGGTDYPSLFDLVEAIEAIKTHWNSNIAKSRDSMCSRIRMMLAMTGDLYNCSVGFPLEKLLDKVVVFELDGVMDDVANFMTNYLLHWLFCYRIGKGERGNVLRNVVVFDECKSVFSPFDNPNIGFASVLTMISMLREFGVSCLASDQTAMLHNILYANTALKVLMPLGSGEDLFRASQSMGLSPEQAAYSYNLGVGEAIVQDQCLRRTYVLQIPKFPLE
jgi:hypothetical protein